MTDHVILRHAKLKSFGEIGGSLDHTFRIIDTPNADSSRLDLNENDFDKKVDVVAAIKNRIDQRVTKRPDNVLCIEYLITASPSWSGFGTDKETEFFEIAKQHLKDKFGEKNVISTHIHRDETTPHLIAYVVPFDEEKQSLNCKKWLGNRTLLQEEQTNIAEKVAHLGLNRGIKNSKAEHQTIKQHYEIINQINEINDFSPDFDNLPKPDFFESKENYAKRAIDTVLPDYKKSKIESIQMVAKKAEVEALRDIAKKAEVYLDAIDSIPSHRIDSLNKKINQIVVLINDFEKDRENKLIEQYNIEIEKLNIHVNNFDFFYDYCKSRLNIKNNDEKLLNKEYSKTEKWLKKNDVTEKEISKGWHDNGSKLYLDVPDFYLDQYNYNQRMKKIDNAYKDSLYNKSSEINIKDSINALNESNHEIGKKLRNEINDYFESFESVIDKKSNDLLQAKNAARSEEIALERRIAQNAIRDNEIRAARDASYEKKRAENEAYRAHKSTVQATSHEKEKDKNIDRSNDFSM